MKNKPPIAPQDTAAEPERTAALLTADGQAPTRKKPPHARLSDQTLPGMMTRSAPTPPKTRRERRRAASGTMNRDAPNMPPGVDAAERRQPQAGGRGTRSLSVTPDSYNADAHTVEAILSAGTAVQRYFFTEELEMTEEAIDLTRVAAGVCPLLDTHNQFELAAQIGRIVAVSIESGQLIGTLQFDQTDAGQLIEARVARGELRAISIGYQVTTWQITSTPGSSDNETWRAMSWQLLEASLVPVPADPNAVVRSAPAIPHGNTHQEDDVNRNLPGGVAHPNANRGAAPAAADTTVVIDPTGATRTEPNGAVVTDPPAQRAASTIAASRILDMCGRSAALGSDFAAELIRVNEATPLDEAGLLSRVNERLLGANRPNIDARAGATGTESDGYRQALEDAVTLRANPGTTMDAHRVDAAREFRGMTLMEQARDYLGRTGINARGMGRMEIAGAALGMRYGALTTSDFANALSTAANKRLRAAFTAAPQTFRPIVSLDTLPDFKPAQIVGLGDAPALLLVPENGEFKRGAITDSGLAYRLQTYGRIIAITRQAIVNDDQSLFNRIPTMFGRKAADLESDLVWGTLTSNPVLTDGIPLFDARHNNLAPVGTGITIAAVAAGEQAMLTQTSNEGGFLTIRPEYLIVGPAKKVEAQQFLTVISAQATAAVNPYPGNLQLIVEPRITGNQWYLSASPDAFDTIVLAHLLGQEELFTDTRVGFDVDGVENKARLDVGAAVIDFRGLYKNGGN